MAKPYNMENHRAYNRAYAARPEQVRKRAQRNAARRAMEKAGAVHKGDGKDVDHKQRIAKGGTNKAANLRAVPKGQNRGWRRGKSGYG